MTVSASLLTISCDWRGPILGAPCVSLKVSWDWFQLTCGHIEDTHHRKRKDSCSLGQVAGHDLDESLIVPKYFYLKIKRSINK